MTSKQQLLYLIENYCNGNYKTKDFASLFVRIYHIEYDGSLIKEERYIMNELSEYTLYYSPFNNKDSISRIIYKNDSEIKDKALKIYKKLLTYYKTTNLNDVRC